MPFQILEQVPAFRTFGQFPTVSLFVFYYLYKNDKDCKVYKYRETEKKEFWWKTFKTCTDNYGKHVPWLEESSPKKIIHKLKF